MGLIDPLKGVERDAGGMDFLAGQDDKREALIEAGVNGATLKVAQESAVTVLREIQAVAKQDPTFISRLNEANPEISKAFFEVSLAYPAQAEAAMDAIEHDPALREQLIDEAKNLPADGQKLQGVIASWFTQENNPEQALDSAAAVKQQIQGSFDKNKQGQADIAQLNAIQQGAKDYEQAQEELAKVKAELEAHEKDDGFLDNLTDLVGLDEKKEALDSKIESLEDTLEQGEDSYKQSQAKITQLQGKIEKDEALEAARLAELADKGVVNAAASGGLFAGLIDFLGPELTEKLLEFLEPILGKMDTLMGRVADEYPDNEKLQEIIKGAKGAINSQIEAAEQGIDQSKLDKADLTIEIDGNTYHIDIDTGNMDVAADFREKYGDDFKDGGKMLLDSSNPDSPASVEFIQEMGADITILQVGPSGAITEIKPNELQQKAEQAINKGQNIEASGTNGFDKPEEMKIGEMAQSLIAGS